MAIGSTPSRSQGVGRRLLWIASEAGHYLCWMGASAIVCFLLGAKLIEELEWRWDWWPATFLGVGIVLGAPAARFTRLWRGLQFVFMPAGIAVAVTAAIAAARYLQASSTSPRGAGMSGLAELFHGLFAGLLAVLGALVFGIAIFGIALRTTRARLGLDGRT